MATNRYGQIWHGDHHHINIRFPSAEARLKFQNEFEAYHASHDHDGDIPTFKCVTTKDLKLSTGDRRPQDLVKAETDKDYRITIDGYSWNEIHDYHNPLTLLGSLGCNTEKQALDFEEYFLHRCSKKIHGDWVEVSEELLSYVSELVDSWDITETERIKAVLYADEGKKARASENQSKGGQV